MGIKIHAKIIGNTSRQAWKCIPVFLAGVLVAGNLFGQSVSKEGRFVIAGVTTGFADSTLLYLDTLSGNTLDHLDSGYIVNNRFRISGALQKTSLGIIRTRNFGDYKYLWLENAVMQVKGAKGRFREAAISGSNTQVMQDELDSAIKRKGHQSKQEILFIGQHPSSPISAYLLSVYGKVWGKDTAENLYKGLSKENQASAFGKTILNFIQLNQKVEIGGKYADISEVNTVGQRVKLSDLKGKVVLLDFWGTWCGPCMEEMPELVKVYLAFKNKGFEIFGVSADNDKKSWLDAVQRDSLVWQNVSELNGDQNSAVLTYGIHYFPANFLIDRDGTILAKDLHGEDLIAKLKDLLK